MTPADRAESLRAKHKLSYEVREEIEGAIYGAIVHERLDILGLCYLGKLDVGESWPQEAVDAVADVKRRINARGVT